MICGLVWVELFELFYIYIEIGYQFSKLESLGNGHYLYNDEKRNQCNYNDGIILTPQKEGYFSKIYVLCILFFCFCFGFNSIDMMMNMTEMEMAWNEYD
jgi:hypothetical protein